MKYDKPLVAALLGAVSTIPAEIITLILVFLGIGKYSIYQLDSLLITFNRPILLLGLIVNFIAGSLTAIVFYFSLKKIGSDYLIIKSSLLGALVWFIFELLFTSTIEGEYIPLRPINDYYIHLLSSLIFGVILGILFRRYLFRSPKTE